MGKTLRGAKKARGNQGNSEETIEFLDDEDFPPKYVSIKKGYGRIEVSKIQINKSGGTFDTS